VKALFLDIDGVLNNSGSCLARTGEKWPRSVETWKKHSDELFGLVGELPYLVVHTLATIDPTAVELVNRLFSKEPELKLVLSTSHRVLFGNFGWGSEGHLKVLTIYMHMLGISADVYGVTPNLNGRRGLEVAAYLDEHPEIDEHCAIDDGQDFLPQDCTFHWVDPSFGFAGKDYFALTRHLRINESCIIV
jgi:hypothetical protein